MSVAAETALREWVNSRNLTPAGQDVPLGAYLRMQRSPDAGAYTVISRQSEGVTNVVAEDGAVSVARMQCLVFAGTEDAAEHAAAALRGEFETLTGAPQPCGDTGVLILVADNLLGPFYIDNSAGSGEQYCFQVNGDFLLTESE